MGQIRPCDGCSDGPDGHRRSALTPAGWPAGWLTRAGWLAGWLAGPCGGYSEGSWPESPASKALWARPEPECGQKWSKSVTSGQNRSKVVKTSKTEQNGSKWPLNGVYRGGSGRPAVLLHLRTFVHFCQKMVISGFPPEIIRCLEVSVTESAEKWCFYGFRGFRGFVFRPPGQWF